MSRVRWGLLGLAAALIGGWLGWTLYDRWKPRKEKGGPKPYSRGWS